MNTITPTPAFFNGTEHNTDCTTHHVEMRHSDIELAIATAIAKACGRTTRSIKYSRDYTYISVSKRLVVFIESIDAWDEHCFKLYTGTNENGPDDFVCEVPFFKSMFMFLDHEDDIVYDGQDIIDYSGGAVDAYCDKLNAAVNEAIKEITERINPAITA